MVTALSNILSISKTHSRKRRQVVSGVNELVYTALNHIITTTKTPEGKTYKIILKMQMLLSQCSEALDLEAIGAHQTIKYPN